MHTDLTIDEMRQDDLNEVLEIEMAAFISPWSEDLFRKELDSPHSCNLVARILGEGKSKVVGYIVFWKVAGEMHILDLAVHSDLRRKGVAQDLLRKAFFEAEKAGCRHAFLEVRDGNAAAEDLYDKFGFEKVGLRKSYYKDGTDALVMGRGLPFE